jgi:hypothetical protein
VSCEKQLLPLLAVQITVFPSSGICIGLAYQHVAADGRLGLRFAALETPSPSNLYLVSTGG